MLARLERIEALDREQAPPGNLLAELRLLLVEAEAWARAEGAIPATAGGAVSRCRELLCGPETRQISSRTLLA